MSHVFLHSVAKAFRDAAARALNDALLSCTNTTFSLCKYIFNWKHLHWKLFGSNYYKRLKLYASSLSFISPSMNAEFLNIIHFAIRSVR